MTYARGYAIFYADLVFLLLHFLPCEGIFLVPAEDDDLTVAEDLLRGRLCLSCKRIFYGSGIGVRYVSLYKTNRPTAVPIAVEALRIDTVRIVVQPVRVVRVVNRSGPVATRQTDIAHFRAVAGTRSRQKYGTRLLHLRPVNRIIYIRRGYKAPVRPRTCGGHSGGKTTIAWQSPVVWQKNNTRNAIYFCSTIFIASISPILEQVTPFGFGQRSPLIVA